MKKLALLVLVFSYISPSRAQEAGKTNSRNFQSYIQAGLLQGQEGGAFQLQTLNGARYGKWFAGLGLALDEYRVRSIPLFIDLRRTFGMGSQILFAYADAGYNFPWATGGQKNFANGQISGGLYSDIGLGWQLHLGTHTELVFSLGYSYKKSSEKQDMTICPFAGPCYVDHQRFDYDLNRLLLKAGISFQGL